MYYCKNIKYDPKIYPLELYLGPMIPPARHDGFGLVIMMMMDIFFHAQALYSVNGKRAYGILAAYHEDHDNDDGFDDDDTPLFSGLKGADSIVCSSIHGGERSAGHLEAIEEVFLILMIMFQQ